MKRILLTAMHSGAGKTVLTCGLLRALQKRGLNVRAFKCGPDYIDPMFHTRVLGVPSRNLDLFLQGRRIRETLSHCEGEIAVLEGAMGYYDGVNGTDQASAWDVARVTETPAVLILRPQGVGISLAAQVRGMMEFRPDSRICALLLSDCRKSLADYLTPVLERETGLPVLGYLPPMEEGRIESRHLGLLTPEEIDDLSQRFDAVAAQLELTVDIGRLLALAAEDVQQVHPAFLPPPRCRIAVARDAAFCFYYEENFDLLRRAGAELKFFSPMLDEEIPENVQGLYLGGGYPELYAKQLGENTSMRAAIRNAVGHGLPTVAECGGFLYLQAALEDAEGNEQPMCGVFSGKGIKTASLRRFGYLQFEAETDSMLFRAGERVPAHEFHHWDCTENGEMLRAVKPNGKNWRCGFVTPRLYAGFPHLHFGGEIPLAERFVKACVDFEGND